VKRFIFATLLLAGCATTGTTTPQNTIYNIKSSFDVALQAVLVYDNLPPCVTNGPKVCSDAKVTQKLQEASVVANTAINSAEAAVRDPNFSASQSQAIIVSAQQAVISLTAILATVQGAK
jgi:hypothetical protein